MSQGLWNDGIAWLSSTIAQKKEVECGEQGHLCLKAALPGMGREVDRKRDTFRTTYFDEGTTCMPIAVDLWPRSWLQPLSGWNGIKWQHFQWWRCHVKSTIFIATCSHTHTHTRLVDSNSDSIHHAGHSCCSLLGMYITASLKVIALSFCHYAVIVHFIPIGTGLYETHDWAYCDGDGDYRITGRASDRVRVQGVWLEVPEIECLMVRMRLEGFIIW